MVECAGRNNSGGGAGRGGRGGGVDELLLALLLLALYVEELAVRQQEPEYTGDAPPVVTGQPAAHDDD